MEHDRSRVTICAKYESVKAKENNQAEKKLQSKV